MFRSQKSPLSPKSLWEVFSHRIEYIENIENIKNIENIENTQDKNFEIQLGCCRCCQKDALWGLFDLLDEFNTNMKIALDELTENDWL